MRIPTPHPSADAAAAGPSLAERAGGAGTLPERLQEAARGPGRVIHVGANGEERARSYAELLDEALRIAHGLRAAGIRPGDFVLLQLERSEDFIPGLWGCLAAGVVPVPVAVAPTFAQPTSALQKLINAAKLLSGAAVLASGAAVGGLRTLSAQFGAPAWSVLDLEELRASKPGAVEKRNASDVAVLLLTSGSTGQPKGVPLTHRNLLAMSSGTIQSCGFTRADVTLNWMALDHVGAVSFLGTMAVDLGCTQIHVPTGYILQEPLRWLDLIARHRATISWAPNFAFTLFLERAAAIGARSWDLSCMRFLVNAGEPVIARTARKFIALLQRHGLPADALRPAFGMSETCSGITWSRGFTLENTADEQSVVDLGPCIAGAAMRVVDDSGAVVAEGEQGLLQLRGPSVFSGYFRNPAENAQVFSDGWFTTGDLACVKDGCLSISGRRKDVIIVNGANFHCHEIEAIAETVPGVKQTCVAACAVRDASAETDRLALFFALEDAGAPAVKRIARALRAKLIQQAGLPPAFLVALAPAEMPRTEIGKIQRAQLKQAFEAGAFRDRVVTLAPARAAKPASAAAAPSRADLAGAIAEIWCDVLGLESVGHDETFFELGGHSLLVVQVQARLQTLIGRPVPVVELFNCPTVRTMAEHFAAKPGGDESGSNATSTGGLETHRSTASDAARSTGGPSAAGGSRDIAIIGIGLRFPGASTPAEFWKILNEERETITFFTVEDALKAGVRPELARDPNFVKAAPMLEAPEAFDAEFFKYSAKEARLIDPQQRVFLEVCWEAFEDAGYDPLTFKGKAGIFAAAGLNTYLANHLLANGAFLDEENGGRMLTVDSMSGFNIMITNDKDYLPTRVSYKLNLRGPSVNVQTACSSTLLTLHEACNSLRLGDCEMALAGGVSIKLPQHAGHLYSAGMLNSPDGHCRAYDGKAEGTIFGNGAGVVLLKPLACALADGDHVYAVVKATAVNNDGGAKVGFTAPSAAGEEAVCAEAIARAGIDAGTITFMEGHGTGTPLGDPIEVEALTRAFRRHTDRVGSCALGSVKTNVGHLQIASGIAGLIKTALALHHRRIPGTLHFEQPNPQIDFSRTPFFVNRHTIPWEASDTPRRAGVNSLGIGGTNVHAILEEAPASASESIGPEPVPGEVFVLPLSARHPAALRVQARRMADFLERSPAITLGDVTYTAQVGRTALPLRAAFVAKSREDLVSQLRAFAADAAAAPQTIDFEKHGLAYHFSGDTVDAAAAAALYAQEPVFRGAIERCTGSMAPSHAASVLRRLTGAAAPAGERATERLALFAFQFGVAEWLGSFGVVPARLSGVGVGERVAACRRGECSLETALQRVAEGPEIPEPAHAPAAGEISPGAAVVEVASTLRLRGFEGSAFGVLARLFAFGFPVRWAEGRRARPARRVPLPTYPWQHHAYWIEGTDLTRPANVSARRAGPASLDESLVGRRWQSPRMRETIYETNFELELLPYLAEHRVQNRIVTPGALYLSQVAQQASDLLTPAGAEANRVVALCDVVFVSPMTIDPARPPVVHTVFTPEGEGRGGAQRFEVLSFQADAPDVVSVHATGRAVPEARSTNARVDLSALHRPCRRGVAVGEHYATMDAMAVELGASFRWVREIHAGADAAWVRLAPSRELETCREWHPGLVDSLLQAAVPAHGLDGSRTLIPFRIERSVFHSMPDGGELFSHALRRPDRDGENGARTDLRVFDREGNLRAEVLGFELREFAAKNLPAPPAGPAEPRCFGLTWEKLATPRAEDVPADAGAWLLLSGGGEVCRNVQQGLAAAGATVTVVTTDEFAPAERHLRAGNWRGIVYGWSARAQSPDAIEWTKLLGCVRAAASHASGTPPRWVFLADRTDERLPAQSPLAGFALGLAHEFPEWRPVHLELDERATDFARWAPWLLDRASLETRLSVRGGAMHGARLVEKVVSETRIQIRPDASYLVTGGAGALGQAVAEWLIRRGARALVLAGRREASARLETRIASWAAAGIRVSYEMGDVADLAAVRQLVSKAEQFGALRGVFHAAGTLRDGLLRQADAAAFVSVFDAKIHGAWNLHLATREKPLDCFVLFSSIASLLGSPAQANYAAGNAFLDGLAEHRRHVGLPALSIQWGPWEGTGMSARLGERDRQRLLDRGLLLMTPAAALQAMERVLGCEDACVGVFAWNRQRYRESLNGHVPALYRRIFAANGTHGTQAANGIHGAPATAPGSADAQAQSRLAGLAAHLTAERADAIERMIREAAASVLGLASYLEVEREKSLFEIGIDSLSAVDLKNRLEKLLGTTLRATVAFDYPTASAMAAHLASSLFPPAAPAASTAPAAVAPKENLGEMSTADLAALLAEELES